MTIKKIERVYVDTSVIGGKFDDKKFAHLTEAFWNAVMNHEIRIIISDIVTDELEGAPANVREFFDYLPKSQIERVTSTEESKNLASEYVKRGVVGKTSIDDCQHIALATINHADCLVSLNFKHIVNIKRILGYNDVNSQLGYSTIEIRTPFEVINDES